MKKANFTLPRKKGSLFLLLLLTLSLLPLCDALFCEVNPIPVKAGMELMGLCEGEVRLPLAQADEGVRKRVKEAIEGIGAKD